MGEPVRKGRPVVKDVLGLGTVQGDGGLEGLVLAPKSENLLFERGVTRLGRDLGVATRAWRLRHGHTVGGRDR